MNNILCHIISLSVLLSVHLFWPLPEIMELSNPETPPAEAFFPSTNEEEILSNTIVLDRISSSFVEGKKASAGGVSGLDSSIISGKGQNK